MSIPQPPSPAKAVVGLLIQEQGLFHAVAKALAAHLGEIDFISPWLPFNYTAYYETEMGACLSRRILTFTSLIEQDELASVKLTTNGLEDRFATHGRRRVNIDPGYMVRERFVLATGKNYSHRIYVGQGIYADLTLIYTHGTFTPLPWTYPDYADAPMLGYLKKIRHKYIRDLKGLKN